MVALGVFVFELAGEHPRDDLHLGVEVGAEAFVGLDAIVVGYDQNPWLLLEGS